MRTCRPLLPLLLAALCAAPAAASRQVDFKLIVPDEGSAGDPAGLAWSGDGERLAFRWNDGEGDGLWVLSPRSGGPPARVVAPGGLPGPGAGRDAEAFQWTPSSGELLVEGGGDLYLVGADGGPRRLTETAAAETGPAFSPDGRLLAYVRDADLHVLDPGSGRERRLTRDGRPGVTLNGDTDWVYWEEIWGREATGFWWSPDSRRIAFYQFDETPVASYPLVDDTPTYPRVNWQRYPKAGTDNPRVRIGVVQARSGGRTVWMQTGEEEAYLARVAWHPSGRKLMIQRLNREQDRLDLLLCDAARGACDVVLTETWPTWINLGNDFAFLSGGGFIRGTEQDGWRRLDLHDAAGRRLRRLTPEGWAITDLLQVDEAGGWLLCEAFRTAGLGATDRHILKIPLAGPVPPAGEVEILTPEPGWNEVLPAPRGGLWVHAWSDADHPRVRRVRGPGLERPLDLPAAPLEFDPADLPRWEFLTLPGPGGDALPARLLRPAGPPPGSGRPALMYHYGGPGSQVVINRWDGRGRDLWHKMMAARGYLVLSVDNQASAFFGKSGEDRQHRRFGEINLAAQLAAVEYLRQQPGVDASRIGLWGWSGGGTNTLYCLLNRPGVWAAGVAGAPVTDWRLYDTIWTERYLDHPGDNPEGYRASSPVTYAAQLADPLLVVHGTGDDNVHPQNTLVLIQALVGAEKLFEDAIYPAQKHGFRGLASRHFYRRMTGFFQRHLEPGGLAAAPAARERPAP